MNGYVEAGYIVVLGGLGAYATSLLRREHTARRRVDGVGPAPAPDHDGTTDDAVDR